MLQRCDAEVNGAWNFATGFPLPLCCLVKLCLLQLHDVGYYCCARGRLRCLPAHDPMRERCLIGAFLKIGVRQTLSLCRFQRLQRERERESEGRSHFGSSHHLCSPSGGRIRWTRPLSGEGKALPGGGWTLFFEWRLEAHRATFPAQTPQASLWETEICPGENVYGRGGYVAKSIQTRMGVECNMGLGRVLLLREFRTFAAMAKTGNAEVPIEIDADINNLGSESGGNRAEGPSPTKKRERPLG